ncbi:MAG: hypothetical protein UX88_C0002G0002 [Candidatus Woesebacteria bacterium GW2011_GWC2_47_16]|uniref:Tetratricopeptide repeat protein n=8 Tax=Candidatus Woeseibacteriota TaxID=1752722 RepID=A0A0G1QSR1_9BACT|nr:MAG: hypothetical protein UX03_C0001G0040 [Candidatus Woesebacteria bacterium GW2011_GWE1_45_18]KKU25118.1 MAG: hypothetical protein UX34_C0003G0043 [Candidatus Woesebacteria bacterium GW2011_GWF1_46_13]KKU47937.1 MAG: hypothetical protein UX67_C0026G0002 [Candidatus Woesebacteria bacterium GW2011_GWF2_46_8]KKU65301.1 MAG: hypothetical protein UX88_C0002G0002 [Candidatus Woesebacteria bacterium GW2011_GWC2_47_16]OGM77315.1 MAG: hypothetical protein A2197_02640 [Candidatus Woesebacteria bacte
MLLFEKSTFGDIQKKIASLREKKGKEKETLSLINKAINFGQGLVVNLMWDRALVYQHLAMQEDSKPERRKNLRKRGWALAKMEASVGSAGKYIKENGLKEWESRYYRFLGRVYDYKRDFAKSVTAYKKAIPLVRLDPEFIKKGYPRWLEIEGFLSYALLMSGRIKEGYSLARKTYNKFDNSPEGRSLKEKDYYTWAIWKSGVVVRTFGVFLLGKYTFDKGEILSWLSEAEKDLTPSKNIRIWGDFSLRKDEVAALKRKLQEI